MPKGLLKQAVDKLYRLGQAAEGLHGEELERAANYRDEVLPAMNEVRLHADRLELLVDDDLWPLPKYRELLFLH